jgi:hypothetical protein
MKELALVGRGSFEAVVLLGCVLDGEGGRHVEIMPQRSDCCQAAIRYLFKLATERKKRFERLMVRALEKAGEVSYKVTATFEDKFAPAASLGA